MQMEAEEAEEERRRTRDGADHTDEDDEGVRKNAFQRVLFWCEGAERLDLLN